ncbi:MAG: NAD(P)H-binding protein [Candidatus Krumholzibacteria bacterium]|nr:NAD(P)H-binding protein [Candidatus Krumholzibacteria bacterium]
MKVLLTGGTGFLGTALHAELRAQGHDVRLLVRRSSLYKVDARDGAEVIAGDVLDTHACLRAVDGCDAVVHLVGIRQERPEQGTTYEAMHTEATYAIVDAAARSRVPRVVYMSGLGTREGAPSRYHRTKWEAEGIVRRSGMRWTIFRPSVVFGPDDEFHPLMIDLVHKAVVPLVDGGTALLQPVSVHNVVRAVAMSLTMPEAQGRIFEVGGPERVAFVDLVTRVARHCEVWPNTVKVSARVMKPVVAMLQRFRNFPLTVDELIMLAEDNVCATSEFTSAFGFPLDTYLDKLPALLDKARVRAA